MVAMARVAALLLLPVLIESVFSISFFLPVNTRKCLREEIHKDVLVTGDYEMSEQPNTRTHLKVSTDLLQATVNVATLFRGRMASLGWRGEAAKGKSHFERDIGYTVDVQLHLNSVANVVSAAANIGLENTSSWF